MGVPTIHALISLDYTYRPLLKAINDISRALDLVKDDPYGEPLYVHDYKLFEYICHDIMPSTIYDIQMHIGCVEVIISSLSSILMQFNYPIAELHDHRYYPLYKNLINEIKAFSISLYYIVNEAITKHLDMSLNIDEFTINLSKWDGNNIIVELIYMEDIEF